VARGGVEPPALPIFSRPGPIPTSHKVIAIKRLLDLRRPPRGPVFSRRNGVRFHSPLTASSSWGLQARVARNGGAAAAELWTGS
jgi:hypothetical protein